MKRSLLLFSLLLSFTSFTSLAAQERWRVSVLAAEITTGGSQPWSDDAHAGIGVGVAYAPTAAWDAELTIASQRHRSPYTRMFFLQLPNGQPGLLTPVTEFREYRVRPVDLSITRHFLAGQPIAPYVRAGVRYVQAPDDPSAPSFIIGPSDTPFVPVSEGFGFKDRTSAQAGAGVRIRLTPRTSMRVEANRLLRSEGVDFDPLTRYAIGVSWLF